MRNTFLSSIRNEINSAIIAEDIVCETESDQIAVLKQTISIIRKLRVKSVCIDTLLRYASGYSIAEIAIVNRLPEGTVKRRVHDARILIRRYII